jgi:hypothetical protein
MPLHSALEAAARYFSPVVRVCGVCASQCVRSSDCRSPDRGCAHVISPGPGLPVTNFVYIVGAHGVAT